MATLPYSLIIFDVDGTLADWKSGELLPGVADWFRANGKDYHFALASNQGGVHLHHYNEQKGNAVKAAGYPTQAQAEHHLNKVRDALAEIGGTLPALFMCFVYTKGNWTPPLPMIPAGIAPDPRWNPANRKPEPGMIEQAVRHFGVMLNQVLMVGDQTEDQIAAMKAGVAFQSAAQFFSGREAEADHGD